MDGRGFVYVGMGGVGGQRSGKDGDQRSEVTPVESPFRVLLAEQFNWAGRAEG